MAEIINIKNEAGEVQYPVTKPECVIDENGKSVLTLIQENGTELRQEIDELSERIDNLPKGDEFDAVDMIREHELEITELQSIIATMQAQLTSLINGGQ